MVNEHIGIDPSLKDALERFCEKRGIAMHRFIRETLEQKIEELMDVEDLPQIRHENSQPLTDVLEEMGL